ncbi:uncharacterized protein LOC125236724 [Leguminivora glycinivorella]|uniref:uncharacterized protein LOC125236724 n=1 Tax=Leguminivora glycinivorella TaxID=1035111 RepID=UPI00200F6751|nr:uncharacterized protein LOC125236724 [Leguminivora glycinivorella]
MLRCGVLVLILVVYVWGEAGEGSEPSQRQYLNALENLPALFNHIIGMLQVKPEVLEKNDVTTFRESPLDGGEISPRRTERNIFKREVTFEHADDEALQGADWLVLKADGKSDSFIGPIPGGFQLTAEEVAEKMLEAEKKLEEYHNETR